MISCVPGMAMKTASIAFRNFSLPDSGMVYPSFPMLQKQGKHSDFPTAAEIKCAVLIFRSPFLTAPER